MTKNHLITTAEKLMADFLTPQLPPELSCLFGGEAAPFFDSPLIGVAAADDALFEALKQPQAVGGHFITPKEWLGGAKSVVSIFVPYSQAVIKANAACPKGSVAPEYIHAKTYAVPYLDALTDKFAEDIKAAGFSVVIPSRETARMKEAVTAADGSRLKFTSGWSERHIAYVCGMGSFGISGGLITPKGVAGRYLSLVTDMPLEADPRPYTAPYEHCTLCGACIARCPAGAITAEKGKDKAKCSAFVNSTKEQYAPLYGCAKCQCGVPCACGVPENG